MYFAINEDKAIKNRIKFRDIQSDTYVGIEAEELEQVSSMTVLFVEGNTESVYPDFIQSPVFLVSDRMKRIIEPYDNTVTYKQVVFNQVKERRQEIFWLIAPSQISCIHQQTKYHPNGWIKHLVLDEQRMENRRIIQVKLLPKPELIFNLDVCEAIMRRDFIGVKFRNIDMSGEVARLDAGG